MCSAGATYLQQINQNEGAASSIVTSALVNQLNKNDTKMFSGSGKRCYLRKWPGVDLNDARVSCSVSLSDFLRIVCSLLSMLCMYLPVYLCIFFFFFLCILRRTAISCKTI